MVVVRLGPFATAAAAKDEGARVGGCELGDRAPGDVGEVCACQDGGGGQGRRAGVRCGVRGRIPNSGARTSSVNNWAGFHPRTNPSRQVPSSTRRRAGRHAEGHARDRESVEQGTVVSDARRARDTARLVDSKALYAVSPSRSDFGDFIGTRVPKRSRRFSINRSFDRLRTRGARRRRPPPAV